MNILAAEVAADDVENVIECESGGEEEKFRQLDREHRKGWK